MGMTPVIGITASTLVLAGMRGVSRFALSNFYVRCVTEAGGLPLMLPNVAPTGKRVEVAVVVIVKMSNGKVVHEHIYWDQASVLVQLGLLDPTGLPVSGAESAHKVLDPKLPPRAI